MEHMMGLVTKELIDHVFDDIGAIVVECTRTYALGPPKSQGISICKTCAQDVTRPFGLCQPCANFCHKDHDLVYLGEKSDFVCDCATLPGKTSVCTFAQDEVVQINKNNVYGQNFVGGGHFCMCNKEYDVREELHSMVKCPVCEEWYHFQCLGLGAPTDDPNNLDTWKWRTNVRPDDIEQFLCSNCVCKYSFLRDLTGLEGCVLMDDNRSGTPDVVAAPASASSPESKKRRHQAGSETESPQMNAKRSKMETSTGESSIIMEDAAKLRNNAAKNTDVVADDPVVKCSRSTMSFEASKRYKRIQENKSEQPKNFQDRLDLFVLRCVDEDVCSCEKCMLDRNEIPHLFSEDEDSELEEGYIDASEENDDCEIPQTVSHTPQASVEAIPSDSPQINDFAFSDETAALVNSFLARQNPQMAVFMVTIIEKLRNDMTEFFRSKTNGEKLLSLNDTNKWSKEFWAKVTEESQEIKRRTFA